MLLVKNFLIDTHEFVINSRENNIFYCGQFEKAMVSSTKLSKFDNSPLIKLLDLNMLSELVIVTTPDEALTLDKLGSFLEKGSAPQPPTLDSFYPDYETFFDSKYNSSVNEENTFVQASSTPDVKLYYPEPFVASPSFIHEEIWFIHILHYNY